MVTSGDWFCICSVWDLIVENILATFTSTEKNNSAWRCYRCNLTFREESHAVIHNEISNHSTRQIELITV